MLFTLVMIFGFYNIMNITYQHILKNYYGHYQTDNGRLIVHMLDTIFLRILPIFWQILNSLMLTGICYFSSKIICKNNEKNVPLISTTMFFLISLLDISITRQSIYWITGSFNYIYPLLMFFIYWYTLTKLDTSKKSFIFSIIFGILASASVEQAGMMTFGLTLLLLLSKFTTVKDFKNFIKNNRKLLILLTITLIGTASVILAPSQFIRLNESNESNLITTIIQNTKFLVTNFTCIKNIFPFMLLYNLSAIVFILKQENKSQNNILTNKKILLACILNILLISYSIFRIHTITSNIIKLILIFGIIFLSAIILIYLNIKIYKSLISILTISVILMLGSEVMMLISPIFGNRNLIFGLIMFAFIIGLIISNIEIKNKISFVIAISLIIIAMTFNFRTALGYHETKLINDKNLEIINNYDKSNSYITLYKFKNDNYAWSMPYISTFHESCYKKFYKLDLDIIWQ